MFQVGIDKPFGGSPWIAFGRKTGFHEGFHIKTGFLAPGLIGFHILGWGLIYADEAADSVVSK